MKMSKNNYRCGNCYFWDKGYCEFEKKRIAEDSMPCKNFDE